jgi:hypothetical protein
VSAESYHIVLRDVELGTDEDFDAPVERRGVERGLRCGLSLATCGHHDSEQAGEYANAKQI